MQPKLCCYDMRDSHMLEFCHAAHGSFVLIAAREGCVLFKGHRRGTLPGLTAPIQIFISHVVIFSHLAFVQMSRFPSSALSGSINVQEAVAVK